MRWIAVLFQADGRTKATVKAIGCYADRLDDDPDLPVIGPAGADQRFCMLNFCYPKVSETQSIYSAQFTSVYFARGAGAPRQEFCAVHCL